MTTTRAHVTTSKGGRYLQQLCKHWAHKFKVTFDATAGHIDFLDGRACGLKAREDALEVSAFGPAEQIDQLQVVIEKHIQRFAHREGELVFQWAPAAD